MNMKMKLLRPLPDKQKRGKNNITAVGAVVAISTSLKMTEKVVTFDCRLVRHLICDMGD
jgi:hypothetical protein